MAWREDAARSLTETFDGAFDSPEDAGAGARLPGHAGGGEVPHWDHPLGAGGVEATVGDLGRYAQTCLHPPGTPLGAAITAAMAPQIPLGAAGDGPWHGRCGRTASACTAAAPAGSPRPSDPRPARPQPPGPEWEDRAREVVRLLLDGRTADVHALGSATFQSHVPAERVERAWRTRTQEDLGPAGQVTIRCQGLSGQVVADVTIAFVRDAVAVRIGFEPSGQLSGLRVLPPHED